MQIKRIKCPVCNAVLDVKNSKNEEVKQISCPSCKTILLVKFQPQSQKGPIEAGTYPPKQPAAGVGATQLAGSNNGATVLGGGTNGATRLVTPTQKLFTLAILLFGGKEYPLKEGQNIVGRKASTSKANVQIETADRYMSRQHCSITVTTLPDGTKKVVLSNYQNKNATTIDGQSVETGDTIRLTDGNSIKMGHTTVSFKLEKQ